MNHSSHDQSWQPTASIENLRHRARILAQIREFFAERQVMEVDTPCLASAPVTDPHLANFSTKWLSPDSSQVQTLYLQTSPEYAMKRLLCSGSGCIYQLGKAFRNEETGRYHNAEFTMLEWYRVDFDHWQLMDEIEQLLTHIMPCPKAIRMSYQDAFIKYLGIDPLTASMKQLKHKCDELGYNNITRDETQSDTLLQLLFSHHIEPAFDKEIPYFVYHFPASQAALARLNPKDERVAERFELYWGGIELANGFHELSDPIEQAQRFTQDNLLRSQLGIEAAQIDERFLQALHAGLPDCAGVALGVDRLIMLATNSTHIEQVIPFTTHKA